MLAEDYKIVPLLASTDTGGGVTLESFKLLGGSATIVMTCGAVTGNAGLKIYSGAAAAQMTSQIDFKIAGTAGAIGAASGDYLSAWVDALAASSGTALTAATYTTKTAVIHIAAGAVDTANNEGWITPIIDGSGSTGAIHAVAYIENPRYQSNRSKTVLA